MPPSESREASSPSDARSSLSYALAEGDLDVAREELRAFQLDAVVDDLAHARRASG